MLPNVFCRTRTLMYKNTRYTTACACSRKQKSNKLRLSFTLFRLTTCMIAHSLCLIGQRRNIRYYVYTSKGLEPLEMVSDSFSFLQKSLKETMGVVSMGASGVLVQTAWEMMDVVHGFA